MTIYKELFEALADQKIEYLVAGGFAVNFHGINRATADLDLIIHLHKDNILKFDATMLKLGYRPRLPVTGQEFAIKENRDKWIQEKNLVVFSYIHPENPFELIDIFAEEPKPYDELYKDRLEVQAFGVTIPVISIDDLIELEQQAGRDKDQLDIKMLKKKKDNGQ